MNIPVWRSGADLPLAARIKRAAFAMTMLIVITLGGALLTLALIEIPANQIEANENAVNVIGEVLSGDVRNQLGNLRYLSRSSLVWTALTDSAGREAYLKPFLQGREKDADRIQMQLLDYRGRRVLGDLPAAIAAGQIDRVVSRVLKQQGPALAVVTKDGRSALLAIFPVAFPYTQETIGALAGVIDLSDLLQRRSAGLGQTLGVELVHQGRAIAVHPEPDSPRFFPANFDLALGERTEGGALAIRLYSTENPWLRPVLERILLSILLAALLGVLLWRISGAIARQISGRLDRLAEACVAISEGRATTVPADSAMDEIGVLSRTLRQAVNGYEQVNAHLENLVAERTRDLSESELNYRTLADSSPALIWASGTDRLCNYFNQPWLKFTGRTLEQELGNGWTEGVHPDDLAHCVAAYTGEFDRRAPFSMEYRLRRHDGEFRWVRDDGVPRYDRDGGFIGFLGFVMDITERKRAEEFLAASEKKFRDLVETAWDWVWEIDENGVYAYCSPRVRELLGYEPAELIGKSPFDLMPAAEAKRLAAVFGALIADRKPLVALENVNLRKDGREAVLETSGVPVFDAQGVFKGYRGIDRDITERKRAEREALEQFKLAEAFFNHSVSSLVILDRNFNFVRVNEAYARACRKDIGEFAGRNHFEMYPSDARSIFEEVVRSKRPYTAAARAFVYADQPERGITYWDWTLVPVLDERGEVEYLVFSLSEATERKRAEDEQRAAALYARSLIEASLDPLVTISAQGKITDVNKSTEQVTGVARERLIGTDFADYFAEPAEARAGYQRVLAQGYVRDYPLTIRHKSGRTTDVLYNATVYRNAAGELQGVFAAARDVTERKRAQRQLTLVSFALNHVHEAAFVIDEHAHFHYVNDDACRALGYSREELLGLSVADLDPDFPQQRWPDHWRELQARKSMTFEGRHRTKGGRLFPVEIAANYFEHEGRAYNLALARDITERKQVEQKLLDSEQRLRLHVEQTPLAVIEWDTAFRVVRWNPSAERFFGYTAAEAMGRHASFIVEAGAKDAVDDVWSRLLAGHGGERSTNQNLTKDGRIILCEWYNTPLVMSDGKVIGVASLVEDVTVRKQAEAVRIQLAAIVQSSHDAIIGKDLDGIITSWNPGAEKVYGYRAAEVVGKPVSMLAPAGRKAEITGLLESVRRGEAVMGFETERYRKDGRRMDVAIDLSPVRDASGLIVGASTIARDVTEKKQAERALRKLNRALKALSNCNEALIHADDEYQLLEKICRVIIDIEGYCKAWVGYVEHDAKKTVRPVAQSGYEPGYLERADITWADNERGGGPLGIAIRSGQIQVVQDAIADPRFEPWRANAARLGYRSVLVAPLLSNSEVIGALSIYAESVDAFDEAEIALLGELAADMAFGIVALRTRSAQEQGAVRLQRSMEATVQAIAGTVEMRDPYTAGHQRRVAELATAIAQDLGLAQDRVRGVHLAGVVHDLGKIHIPAEILSKPGKLTRIEYELIKSHPESGYEILKGVDFPWPIAQIVLQHHERQDGSGYPCGLKADDILPEARILAVADVVEAMASHRPYRPALGIELALQEIGANAGKFYDPDAARACIALFRDKAFTFKG